MTLFDFKLNMESPGDRTVRKKWLVEEQREFMLVVVYIYIYIGGGVGERVYLDLKQQHRWEKVVQALQDPGIASRFGYFHLLLCFER